MQNANCIGERPNNAHLTLKLELRPNGRANRVLSCQYVGQSIFSIISGAEYEWSSSKAMATDIRKVCICVSLTTGFLKRIARARTYASLEVFPEKMAAQI